MSILRIRYQRTALHYGSAGGHHDNVRVLLERGADPNTRDKSTGWTALMFAVNEGHKDIVQTDWCLLELMFISEIRKGDLLCHWLFRGVMLM
jgi:ankyrin repeat protein